jgi:hypothetical protein
MEKRVESGASSDRNYGVLVIILNLNILNLLIGFHILNFIRILIFNSIELFDPHYKISEGVVGVATTVSNGNSCMIY